MKFKKIVMFMSVLGMLSCSFPKISYADKINIKYDNKNINYSDKQVQYKINGSKIKSKYPGIIIDGISLASAKEIFSDSKIGLSYKFSKNKNTLELKRDGKTLVFTLNSYKAKVDGKNETVPIKPRLISFPDKASKVYVPARYVAKIFGLTYDWDAASGIAAMTGKTVTKKNNKKTTDKKTTKSKKNNKAKKESFSYNGKNYNINGKKIIFNINKTKLNNAKLPGVYVGTTLMAPAKSLFLSNSVEGSYSYNKSKRILTLGFDDNILTMTLGSKSVDYNGTQVKLDKAPNYIKLGFSGKNEIYVPIENICELFEIDIETSGIVSTLSLPETDDIEDIIDNNDDIDTKPDTKPDKKTNTNNNKPAVTKPAEPFVAKSLPFSWKAVNNIKNLTAAQSISGNNKTGASSIIDITSVNSDMSAPFDSYVITSTAGFSGVRGNLTNNQLTISMDNMTSNGGQNYASSIRTVNYINVSYNAGSNSSDVNFGLVDGVIGYDMSFSNDNKALTIRIYRNTITEITGNYSNGTYTFTLTGLAPLTVQENGNSDSNLNLIIPNIIDTIGSGSYVDNVGSKLTLFNYFNNGTGGASISINKASTLNYYTSQSGNSVSIILSEVSNNTAGVDGAIISLPANIDASEIENEDNYFSNNFTITLPGDLRNHFNQNPVKYDTSKVKNVTTALNDDGNTVLTFYTTRLYAYRLNITKSQIKVAIDNAKKLYSKVVVIDPGHGGHDNGTESFNGIYKEKNVVLSIGYTYFRNYLNDDDLKVYWTRKDDTYPTLPERAAFAKKVDADIFISVHMNAFPKSTPKGTEIFYSTRNNILQPNGLSSYTMASMFLKNITSTFNTYNRGVKTAAYVVTNMNTVPAVLLEYGFLTNKDDLDKFSKLENQDKAAEVLYDTIEEIFDNYPTGR